MYATIPKLSISPPPVSTGTARAASGLQRGSVALRRFADRTAPRSVWLKSLTSLYQLAECPNPCPSLLGVTTLAIVSIALAFRAASTPAASMHSAPRSAVDRRRSARPPCSRPGPASPGCVQRLRLSASVRAAAICPVGGRFFSVAGSVASLSESRPPPGGFFCLRRVP